LKEIAPRLQQELGIKNINAVPKILKIVINVGIGSYMVKHKDYDEVVEHISIITGQRPVVQNSKMAISNFKLRKDMPVGVKVTLRKKRMYDFFGKLVHVVFPRLRDFRGFEKKYLDGRGNLSLGLKDYSVFPEIIPEDITKTHGLQITVVTSSKNNEQAIALFKLFNFPFKK
jgi:large subunit ribosomal protein L5